MFRSSSLSDALRDIAGDVVLPGDPQWDSARQAWNLAVDQHPVAVALPRTAADIVAIVDAARERGLRVAAQGTGHNASALGSLESTVLVKTERMRDVHICPEARYARVEAGAQWIDVTAPASEHGLAALAGSAADVGVVGYSLGGGIGWLAREHGLATNSIIAIELVTADGELVRTDARNEPELFWALRGGGGNFGVVTAMEFNLYDAKQLYAGAMLFPWERSAEVLHRWREWTLDAPRSVTTSARIMQFPPFPEVPEPLRGRAFVVVDGAYNGPEAEGAAAFAPLRDLGPEVDLFAAVPPVALSHIHMDPPEPVPGRGDGTLLGELPASAIDAFVAAAGPEARSQLLVAELRQLGGAAGEPAAGGGALDRLDGAYALFGAGMAPDSEIAALVDIGLERLRGAMAPWDAGRPYLNFAERSDTDVAAAYAADAHDRLRAVKAQVDPHNLIQANHEIAPA